MRKFSEATSIISNFDLFMDKAFRTKVKVIIIIFANA